MILGPAAIRCSFADRMREFLEDTFVKFGRVPPAFRVAHLYLLHLLAPALGALQDVPVSELMTFPPFFPKNYGIPPWGVYGVWALVVVILYPFCR